MRNFALLVMVISILSFVAIGCEKQQIVSDTDVTGQQPTEQEEAQEVAEMDTEGDLDIEQEDIDTTDVSGTEAGGESTVCTWAARGGGTNVLSRGSRSRGMTPR